MTRTFTLPNHVGTDKEWRVLGADIPKEDEHYLSNTQKSIQQAHCDHESSHLWATGDDQTGGVRIIVEEVKKPLRLVLEATGRDTIEVGEFYTYAKASPMRRTIFSCDMEPIEIGDRELIGLKLVEGEMPS